MSEIHFRPLCAADLPMLHEWIHRPHVAEWWGVDGPPRDLEDTRGKYLPRVDESSATRPYIAMLSGQPIGFAQSYIAAQCGDGWWEDETDPGVHGTDHFLCDASMLGRGLGTRMVSAFVRRLFENPAVTRVQTDPDPRNARAIRCYEKVGFRRSRLVDTPNGKALLMTVTRGELNP